MHREIATLILILPLILLGGCYNIHKDELGYYEEGTLYLWSGGSGTGEMQEGKKEGYWTIRDENRNISGQGAFEKDQMQGQWIFFFPAGGKKSEGPFTHDQPHGEWVYYYENGQPESTGVMENGEKKGYWRYFYPSGNLMSIGQLEAGQRTGKWEFFYDRSELQTSSQFASNLKETRLYQNGLNYLVNSFNPSGKSMVVNGEGPYEYYENGKLKEKGQYKDSLATGLWTFYDAAGKVIETKTAEKGVWIVP